MRVRVQPERLREGVVKVECVSGSRYVMVWTNNTKTVGSEFELGKELKVPDDFVVEGDSLVKTVWVEGIKPHREQRGTRFRAELAVGNVRSEDEVSLTVVGVEKVEWEGCTNSVNESDELDGDPNWPKGLRPGAVRVFPDARVEGGNVGNARDRVKVKVELSVAPPETITVYLRSFDVDDPVAEVGPVDPPGGGSNQVEEVEEDNRGDVDGKKSGKFEGEDGSGVKAVVFEANVRSTNSIFRVTMQPGDNFRVVANGDRDFLLRLSNNDKELNVGGDEKERNENKQRIVDRDVGGEIAKREVRFSEKYASEVVVVWRFLHVEVDSMGAPPETGGEANVVRGVLRGVSGDGSVAQRVYLNVDLRNDLWDGSLNLDSSPAGNGRFEKGWIKIGEGSVQRETRDLVGNGDRYVRKDGGIDIPAKVTKEGERDVSGKVVEWDGQKEFRLVVTSGTLSTNYNGGMLNVAGVSVGIATVVSGSNIVRVVSVPSIPFILHDDDDDRRCSRA